MVQEVYDYFINKLSLEMKMLPGDLGNVKSKEGKVAACVGLQRKEVRPIRRESD